MAGQDEPFSEWVQAGAERLYSINIIKANLRHLNKDFRSFFSLGQQSLSQLTGQCGSFPVYIVPIQRDWPTSSTAVHGIDLPWFNQFSAYLWRPPVPRNPCLYPQGMWINLNETILRGGNHDRRRSDVYSFSGQRLRWAKGDVFQIWN